MERLFRGSGHILGASGLSGGHFGVVGLIWGGVGVHREAFGRPLGLFWDVLGVPESFFDRFRIKC